MEGGALCQENEVFSGAHLVAARSGVTPSPEVPSTWQQQKDTVVCGPRIAKPLQCKRVALDPPPAREGYEARRCTSSLQDRTEAPPVSGVGSPPRPPDGTLRGD